MDRVRVMIVEDSPTAREYLRAAISSDPRLAVVAECESAEQALADLDRSAPDVISMDIHLPRMSGLDATRRIMETRPTPIVVISRSVNAAEVDTTMDALRAGAVSAVEKPTSQRPSQRSDWAHRVCRELAAMSQIKVVRQRFNRARTAPILNRDAAAHSPLMTAIPQGRCVKMVGIVASTGGPRAVETVLGAIGPDFPIPIVLVQHMTASFHGGFVTWLDRVSPQPVIEARQEDCPTPGHVYVAPADKHLVVARDRLLLNSRPPVNGQRPSGTVLFRSLAEAYGSDGVGVLLTGMGDDGAEGLLSIRSAGGWTIAEDAATAVVNGMPQAARDLNASCVSLPLESIGAAIRQLAPADVEMRS